MDRALHPQQRSNRQVLRIGHPLAIARICSRCLAEREQTAFQATTSTTDVFFLHYRVQIPDG